jgi:hypothetical protein
MSKPLVAQQRMMEFDSECEKHFPLLVVKAVDPGCTLELQIEDARTGQITRLTTTDGDDRAVFEAALLKAFRAAWQRAEASTEI